MADLETTTSRFSSHEKPEELETYRRVNPLAVIALIVAAISAVALIHPLLWVVPVVAAGLAISALRQIHRSPELAGRGAAIAALVLALLLGSWSVSWVLIRQSLFTRQAQAHAEHWFDLVREGKLREAHQLTKRPYERAPENESLEEYYSKESTEPEMSMPGDPEGAMEFSPQQDLDAFFSDPVLAELVAQGETFEHQFVRNQSLTRIDAQMTVLVQRFRLRYQKDGRPRDVELDVRLERNVNNGRAYWHIASVKAAEDS